MLLYKIVRKLMMKTGRWKQLQLNAKAQTSLIIILSLKWNNQCFQKSLKDLRRVRQVAPHWFQHIWQAKLIYFWGSSLFRVQTWEYSSNSDSFRSQTHLRFYNTNETLFGKFLHCFTFQLSWWVYPDVPRFFSSHCFLGRWTCWRWTQEKQSVFVTRLFSPFWWQDTFRTSCCAVLHW